MRGIEAQTGENIVRRLRGVRGVVHAVHVVFVVVAGSLGVDPGDARELFESGVPAQRGAEARGDASVRAEHAIAKGSHRAARQGGWVGGDVAEDVAEEDFLRERGSGEGGVPNLEKGERESHEEVARGEREGVRLGPSGGGVSVGVRTRVVGALTGRVRQLGEGREREVEVAKHLPRERATPRGHGREEREGAVVPDAYPAREMRVDRAHATLKHRARKAVELEVDESLRRGRVRGKATQHVREEAQQGDAHLLRVVQMVRVPQRQDVCEPGGHLEVRLRESKRKETAREEGPSRSGSGRFERGGAGGGPRGMSSREIASAAAAVRSAVSRTFTTHSGPSGDPRSSLRIADNAEATTCGSSETTLSRDTFARRAPSRSAREAGVAPSPIAREELQRPTPPRAGFQRAIILDNQPRKNATPRRARRYS